MWLSGVRRIGKTTLAKNIPDILYVNCDLPSFQKVLEDPENFYKSIAQPVIVFDEIHQLPDPSLVLKIGTDEFPQLKILATGSSTLTAAKKFRDSLTGRKYHVHLLPVLLTECLEFKVKDIKKRLFHGGLPEALMSSRKDPEFFTEWLDSYYARDIQELFRVDKRYGFFRLAELLFRQSGTLMEITQLSKHSGLSRPTVMHYLDILQKTHLTYLLRPFHGGGRQEFLHQPKAYAFDTGFVTFYKGWQELREEDCGILWEHVVFEFLLANFPPGRIYYWRNKQKREVDFILDKGRDQIDALECKWNPERFEIKNLLTFRENYPSGKNYVLSPNIVHDYQREIRGLKITFCNPERMIKDIF